ncbi:MAG: hypothetical protein ACI32Z_00945 [Clostridium sp.]
MNRVELLDEILKLESEVKQLLIEKEENMRLIESKFKKINELYRVLDELEEM